MAILLYCITFSLLLAYVLAVSQPVFLSMNIGGPKAGDYRSENPDWFADPMQRKDGTVTRRKLTVDPSLVNPPELSHVLRSQVSSHKGDLTLKIPAEPGVYTVHLLFAELWPKAFSPGVRMFDINVGSSFCGEKMIKNNYDVFTAAGSQGYTGVVETIPNVATKGGITVRLHSIKQNAVLNGIVIEGVQVDKEEVSLEDCKAFGGIEGSPNALNEGSRPPASAVMAPPNQKSFDFQPEVPLMDVPPRQQQVGYTNVLTMETDMHDLSTNEYHPDSGFNSASQSDHLELPSGRFFSHDIVDEKDSANKVKAKSMKTSKKSKVKAEDKASSGCINTAERCTCSLASSDYSGNSMCLFEFSSYGVSVDRAVCRLAPCIPRHICSCPEPGTPTTVCEKRMESSILFPLEEPQNGYLHCRKEKLEEPIMVLQPTMSLS